MPASLTWLIVVCGDEDTLCCSAVDSGADEECVKSKEDESGADGWVELAVRSASR